MLSEKELVEAYVYLCRKYENQMCYLPVEVEATLALISMHYRFDPDLTAHKVKPWEEGESRERA